MPNSPIARHIHPHRRPAVDVKMRRRRRGVDAVAQKDRHDALDAVAHGTARVERLPRVLVIGEEDRVAGAGPQRQRPTAMARERRRAAERRRFADEQHRRHPPARLGPERSQDTSQCGS